MSNIAVIHARQILDSRGNPTVEAEVTLTDGSYGRAATPSGASTGAHEAWELRDGDASVYAGKGVLQAVENINGPIADALLGMDALDQFAIDSTYDRVGRHREQEETRGQCDPGRLSLAAAQAAAQFTGQPLYRYLGGAGRESVCRRR